MPIFDRKQISRAAARATSYAPEYDFLINHVWHQVIDRTQDIKRNFSRVLVVGPRSAHLATEILQESGKIGTDVTVVDIPENEILPITPEDYDLVLCVFELHRINDLPTFLAQLKFALKPGGVMLAAMPGGKTLYELRASLTQAEMDLTGGAAPRVHPFLDAQQLAAMMQAAAFNLPVVDTDVMQISYANLHKLCTDLRGMGATNALVQRHRQPPKRALFETAQDIYRRDFGEQNSSRIPVTVEIIHLIGWANGA